MAYVANENERWTKNKEPFVISVPDMPRMDLRERLV